MGSRSSHTGGVLILTPFRAQRARIEKLLRSSKLLRTKVSTIHKAQGAERRVVIFDPVKPSAEFLNGEEGKRLINVAISRAEAQLIVLLHPDYMENPILLSIAQELQHRKVHSTDFPVGPPRQFPTSAAPKEIVPQPAPPVVPKVQTLGDQYKSELYREALQENLSGGRLQRLARDLASKAKYRKLGYSEADLAFEEVRRNLLTASPPK
jgi:AAA domain